MQRLIILAICLTAVELAFGLGGMAGGLSNYDLNNSKNVEKINELTNYAVGQIAKQRMEEAKKSNVVSSSTPKKLEYSNRIVTARCQVVAGEYNFRMSINFDVDIFNKLKLIEKV